MLRYHALAIAITLAITASSTLAATPLESLPILTGLNTPTFLTGAPGDLADLYITQKGSNGSASIIDYNTVTHVSSTFLTINGVATDSEEGLVGLTFDPDYATNGMFYVNYVSTATTVGTSTIAQYHATSATSADAASAKTLLTFDQPQTNHNGGWIGFSTRPGDDHNLYIATGDGGNGNDSGAGHAAGGNAQSLQTDLGKILRIHVDPITGATSIPSNNPYATSSDPTVKKEIFLTGLRNPFRDSFDNATGTLYIGDVGQDNREELDVQTSAGGGENYGWRLREGNIQTPAGGVGGPPPAGYVAPILDYAHDPGITTLAGRTIIGGYVYRGSAIPDLVGTYIFGDYLGSTAPGARTEVFSLTYDGSSVSNLTDLTSMLNPGSTPLIGAISSFGQDTAGNLYIVDINNGTIFEIVPVPEPASLTLAGVVALALFRRRQRRPKCA